VTIDGNAYPVFGNPQTFGPFTVGAHRWAIGDGSGTFDISACAEVTVTTTCSTSDNPTGSATFSGVTVEDELDVMDSTNALAITSNPFTVSEIGVSYDDTYVESGGGRTVATGSFAIAACVA
jgi:hypothetical protein